MLAEIREGAVFEDVAARESADSSSRVNGGDLGEAERGRFVAEFEEAALALSPGEVSEPVLSPFGYHIIKLESKSRDSYHARHILVPVELYGEHLVEVESRADTLDLFGAVQTDPTEFDAVAERLGLEVKSLEPVYQDERLRVAGSPVPDASVWAFGALRGESSPVIESPGAYYLFRLDSLEEAGVAPFEAVRAEVRAAAVSERKTEVARQLARRVADRLKASGDLAAVAGEFGLQATGLPPMTRRNPSLPLVSAPGVVGLVFGLRSGEWGGPVEANSRFYFAETRRKVVADSGAFEARLDSLRAEMLLAARQERVQLVLSSLLDGATVLDQRREVERRQREFADQQADGIPGLPIGAGF